MSDGLAPDYRFPREVAQRLVSGKSPTSTLLGHALAACWIALALIGAVTPWVVIAFEVIAPGWLLR